MELCTDDHDEVCFDSRNCPVCNIKDELEERIDNLENNIIDLENTVIELESEEQNNG